jgi:hypothetical protein
MGTRLSRKGFAGRRNLAGLLVVAVASIIGVSVYAFTASNTVAAHSAGAGSATVSGYTIASPTTCSAATARKWKASRSTSTSRRRMSRSL